MVLSAEEVCKEYRISEAVLKNQFKRVQEQLRKEKNVYVTKIGRGNNTLYDIDDKNYPHALTLYKEEKNNVALTQESLSFAQMDFTIFLAIMSTPGCTFKDSYVELLKYIEVPVTEKKFLEAREALQSLKDRKLIVYEGDPKFEGYFTASAFLSTEVIFDLEIDMKKIRVCRELAKQYNKRSPIPLLKTWLGIELLIPDQPFTIAQLSEITGLSEYQLRESHKILKSSNIFLREKAYRTSEHYIIGLGSEYTMTAPAFYVLENKQGSKK